MAKAVSRPAQGRGWLRIIGGAWRGRKIPVAETEHLRPTNERAREAIFNRLLHGEGTLGVRLVGAHVVDLFAGTGALGLEALSRGAARAVFVERDVTAAHALELAIAALGAEDRANVLRSDATSLPPAPSPCDVLFLDPPYGGDTIGPALTSAVARGWIKPGGLVVLETEVGTALALPPGLTLIDHRRYGRAEIYFLSVI
jgi:16S rRNA (guanine966-N2)-methyltransferase